MKKYNESIRILKKNGACYNTCNCGYNSSTCMYRIGLADIYIETETETKFITFPDICTCANYGDKTAEPSVKVYEK